MKSDEDQSLNGKRKTILMIAISLMIGFGGGWFSFRSKEIVEWHRIRNLMHGVGVTDEDWDLILQNMPEMRSDIDELMEDMDAGRETNAAISLAAFKQLEAGKLEQAKKFLAKQVASYYFVYGPPDHTEKNTSEEEPTTLKAIQKAMEESPFLEAEVKKALSKYEK